MASPELFHFFKKTSITTTNAPTNTYYSSSATSATRQTQYHYNKYESVVRIMDFEELRIYLVGDFPKNNISAFAGNICCEETDNMKQVTVAGRITSPVIIE